MKDLKDFFTSLPKEELTEDSSLQNGLVQENQLLSTDSEDISEDKIPYAVRSLEDAIQMVLSDEIFSGMLTDVNQVLLRRFCSLSERSKLICCRLFGRVQLIFRKSELCKFLDDSPELYLNELVTAGILSTDLDAMKFEDILKALNRHELQDLASRYNVKNWKKIKMSELVSILLKISSGSSLSKFFGKDLNTENNFRKQLHRVLGSCWRVDRKYMRLLSTVLWITSLGSDTSFSGPQRSRTIEGQLKTELYNMMLVRRGDILYPAYRIQRCRIIYRDPEEIDQYMELLDHELKLEHLVTERDFTMASNVFESVRLKLLSLATNSHHLRTDLPVFLRRFTAPYRAFRLLLVGLDLMERQKRYKDAVSLIKSLLFRTDVADCASAPGTCPLDSLGPCRAGRLLMRLLIDEGSHLGRPASAIDMVRKFLGIRVDCQDATSVCPCLRAGLRLGLQEQLLKVAGAVKPPLSHCGTKNEANARTVKRRRLESSNGEHGDCEHMHGACDFPNLLPALLQAPKVEIKAPVNASSKVLGTHRPHYLWFELPPSSSQGSSTESAIEPGPDQAHTLLLTVEQWTLRHYTNRLGFAYGLHSESRVYHLLFVLLFYDILFDDTIPDVFYSFRQSEPMDLSTDDFYASRRSAIDERLSWILEVQNPEQLSIDETDPVGQKIKDCWDLHHGERCVMAGWDLFSSPKEVSDLFWCLGNKVVHAVCRQLATDFRSWRSGLPDLLVWTPTTNQAKIVEVKGPGDHLSTQQIMWLDVLVGAGADVEICHVIAVSQKSLQNQNNA